MEPTNRFMTTLDNIKQIQKLDKSNMAGYILEMPKQIEESLKKVEKIKIPKDWGSIKNVCLCGMGGSGIVNHLIANLPQSERIIPMQVIRGYNLPSWVDNKTLVILTSHSGNTAETLSVFERAKKVTQNIFVVTTGGKLAKKANPAVVFDYKTSAPPRASLGYQLGAVFGLLNKLKIINQSRVLGIEPAIELIKKINEDYKLEILCDDNLAKKLAFCCLDRLPVIIGSGILQSVAWRWKTQINENANQLSFTEFLPEAMHNAIQGLGLPERFQDDLIYIILKNSFDSKELILQFKNFENILEDKKIRYEIIEPLGDNVWSQKLSSLILGDWVSYYLALLNGIDPTPVETIEKAKK